jgi:hypothetical protein
VTAAEIIAELDDHGFTDSTEERKLAVINSAIWDVCTRENWGFLEAAVTLSFDGTTGVAVEMTGPDPDIADVRVVLWAQCTGDNSRRLSHIRLDDWLERYLNADDSGVPRFFYFIANEMTFWPTPAATDEIVLYYIKVPPAIDADSTEADIILPADMHRELIVNGALYKLYAMEDDTDIAPTFQGYWEQAIQRLHERARRQVVDMDYVREVDTNPDDEWA